MIILCILVVTSSFIAFIPTSIMKIIILTLLSSLCLNTLHSLNRIRQEDPNDFLGSIYINLICEDSILSIK